MSSTVVKRGRQSRLFDPSRRVRTETRTASGPARPTLAQMLGGVWEGLATTGSAPCPLCGEEMRREPGRAEGRCGGCGTALG